MNKRHYEHTLPNIRGSLSNTYSASYTLRGFALDARGAINDVLDSFTLPVFGGFMLGGIILGLIQQWDNIIDKV